jgi:hypothetical protein
LEWASDSVYRVRRFFEKEEKGVRVQLLDNNLRCYLRATGSEADFFIMKKA